MKVECSCKQCGKVFVKYAYQRTVRCEECRKLRREADTVCVSKRGDKGHSMQQGCRFELRGLYGDCYFTGN